jgi:hypothetical protein
MVNVWCDREKFKRDRGGDCEIRCVLCKKLLKSRRESCVVRFGYREKRNVYEVLVAKQN